MRGETVTGRPPTIVLELASGHGLAMGYATTPATTKLATGTAVTAQIIIIKTNKY
jgi:hypothetical protein